MTQTTNHQSLSRLQETVCALIAARIYNITIIPFETTLGDQYWQLIIDNDKRS